MFRASAMTRAAGVTTALAISVLTGGCSSNGGNTPTTVTVTSAASSPAAAPTPTAASPATTMPSPGGVYQVGVDIQPGTYKSMGPVSGSIFCSWFRLKDLSGSPSAYIAGDNQKGPVIVTIDPTDAGFKSSGCQSWAKLP